MASSVAIQRNPAWAASSATSSDTDPSDGHSPAGSRPNSRWWHSARPAQLLRRVLWMAERRPRHGRGRDACAGRCRCRTATEESDGRTARSTARPVRAPPPARYSGMTRRRISSSTSRSSSLSASVKSALLLEQRGHARIGVEIERIDPGQLVPHLKVEEIAVGECPARVPLLQRARRSAGSGRSSGRAGRGKTPRSIARGRLR